MTTRLHQFMRNVHNAHPLSLSTATIVPGTLLQTRWRAGWPWNSNPEFQRQEGMAWEVLEGVEPEDHPTTLHDANILVGSITDRISFGLELPLPQFGISIGAGFERARTAKLTVDTVRARLFNRGFSGHELRRRLRDLRRADDHRWVWVDDDFLVTECFYTGDLRFDFKEEGELSAKAEFELTGVEFSAKLTATWLDEQSLVLKGTANVPFAVRGIKV